MTIVLMIDMRAGVPGEGDGAGEGQETRAGLQVGARVQTKHRLSSKGA